MPLLFKVEVSKGIRKGWIVGSMSTLAGNNCIEGENNLLGRKFYPRFKKPILAVNLNLFLFLPSVETSTFSKTSSADVILD